MQAIDQSTLEKSDIHTCQRAPLQRTAPAPASRWPAALFAATEISLRGLVLPVGGIKEKVVAAARAGLKRAMLPARSRRDFDDIPEEARAQLEFIWLERAEDAVHSALEQGAQTQGSAARVM